MTSLIRFLARWLLAGAFIILGWDAAREPGARVQAAEKMGLPQPDLAVRLNGLVMVAGGLGIGLGIFRRLSALGIVASLLPTTYAGHAFWEHEDPQMRQQHIIQFLKNASMLGGVLLVLTERGKDTRHS